MKWLGYLLIAGSLVAGVISATTAYLPPLSRADEQLIGLTLNANAGRKVLDDGSVEPLARDEQTITPELLTTLREAGVKRVRVKEFSFGRWTHKGWFLLSIVGLLAGGWMLRTRPAAARARPGGADNANEMSPDQAMERMQGIVKSLQRELPALPDESARLRTIGERLGEAQSDLVPAVASGRDLLVSRLGLGGYAEFMDRFAAAERQINRAWSAAADGAYAEAADSIDLAVELCDRAADRLARSDTRTA